MTGLVKPEISDAEYAILRQSTPIFRDGARWRAETVCAVVARVVRESAFRLLDVGTADGLLLEMLQARYPCSTLIGLDRSAELLGVARRKGLSVVKGDGQCLPVNTGAFDFVVLSAILKHIHCSQQALQECKRMLKPGGHLILLDPTTLGIRLGLLLRHFTAGEVFHIWSTRRATSECTAAGFELVFSDKFMLFPSPIFRDWLSGGDLRRLGVTYFFLQQIFLFRSV
jgi:SAM-dependent methyltransferase